MKKIIATSGLLAYMLYFNSTGAVAAAMPEITPSDLQTTKYQHSSARHEKNFLSRMERLADKFGIDQVALARDIDSGMSSKQILKKYGISKNQLREIVGNRVR
jgi:microsomal dipeptidase-like Zn-dependent dipeptidase